MVFLEALDCFVACMPKRDKRLPLAEAIAAKLNITKVKVSYILHFVLAAVGISHVLMVCKEWSAALRGDELLLPQQLLHFFK